LIAKFVVVSRTGHSAVVIETGPDRLGAVHLRGIAAAIDGPIDCGEVLVESACFPKSSAVRGVRDKVTVEVVRAARVGL
jgi:hypothetical protein